MSNIVLNSLTYVGEGFTNGIAYFYNRTAGVIAGMRRLQNRQTLSKEKVATHWKLTLPYIVEADSACGCKGDQLYLDSIVDISVSVDKRLPEVHREHLLQSIKDLADSIQFDESIVNQTPQT